MDEKKGSIYGGNQGGYSLIQEAAGKRGQYNRADPRYSCQVGKVQISLELLKSTKIGKTVGRLRNSKNEKVAAAALEIVGKWRKVAATATAVSKAKAKAAVGNKSQSRKLRQKRTPVVPRNFKRKQRKQLDKSAKTNSTEAKAVPEEAKKVEAPPISFEHKQSGMRINACKALLRNLMRGTDATKFGGKSFSSKVYRSGRGRRH